MKSTLVAIICFLGAHSAYANCTPTYAMQDARNELQKIEQSYQHGSVGKIDVLMAKENVLNLSLSHCNSEWTSQDFSNFKDLATNLVAQLALTTTRYNYGLGTEQALILARAKVEGLAKVCPELEKYVTKQFQSGVASAQDLATLKSACDLLPMP